MRTSRLFAVPVSACLLSVSLVACAGTDQNDVAGELATGLSTGKLTGVPFTGTTAATAAEERTNIVKGLGKAAPKVVVAGVSKPADDADGVSTATATLKHTWQVPVGSGTQPWSYETKATLVDGEDGWAVRWQPSVVAPVATGETLSIDRTQPARADILGAGAVTLVSNRPVSRFGIDRGAVPAEQADASARALATLVGIDPNGYAGRVTAAGPKQFVQAIVLRSDAVPDNVRAGYAAIAGATVVQGEQPLAATRDFARPILGTVGEATKEVLEKNPTYRAGDIVGLGGLQARYNDDLAGTAGEAVQASRPGGTPRTLFAVNAVPGKPLQTTLDQSIQTQAEALLAGVAPASSIVVVKPSTGQVLAAASGPGGDGYSTSTLGKYAPGSTFKVVTALALLRSGLTPDSPLECPATITVDGRTFSNYSEFPADRVGTMTLRQALALSCNTAFIGAAEKVAPDQLASAAASLGIGFTADQVGADAFGGSVPTDGTATEAAAARIGQGKVTASPLAMATVAASVMKGGTVTPHLLDTPAPPAAPAPAVPLTPAEADALRSMMGSVVTEGTGSVVAGVPGQPVVAKTGTAEFGDATPPATRAWMIAGRGDLAVSVFVAEGPSGSHTAGPIMAKLLEQLTV